MSKKIKGYVKLQIAAGSANPSPPVGPSLGQQGINIMEFCKSFNERTISFEKGISIPVIVTVYTDRTFSFIIKSPPASVLLKKAANLKSGSKKAKSEIIGFITRKQIEEIAKIKMKDMTGSNIKAMSKSIEGTANSMGIVVKD